MPGGRTSLVDMAMGLGFRVLPANKRAFRDGWGDPEAFALLDTSLPLMNPAPLEIEWSVSTSGAQNLADHRIGTYWSPLGFLPDEARTGQVLEVTPQGGTRRWCVLHPAWNDEGFSMRLRLAHRLALRGIGSLIPEAAYYGSRRVNDGAPIATVAEFARMSRAVVEEARSIALRIGESGGQPGVAGYSMGGSLAALTGVTVPDLVAIAPMAASYSPAPVFTDGVIRTAVDWNALGGDTPGSESLREILSLADTRRISPTASTASAVLVAAEHDGYVPRAAVAALHAHWPGSELRTFSAGHSTLIYRMPDALVGAIEDSFNRTHGET